MYINESPIARILRYLAYAAVCTPLVIGAGYSPHYGFLSAIIFRSIVLGMVPLFAFLILRNRTYIPKSNIIIIAVLVFVAVFFLTSLTSFRPHQSVWGTLQRMGGLYTYLHYIIFFFVLTAVMRTKAHWNTLFYWIIGATFASTLYGVAQMMGLSFVASAGTTRMLGTVGNAAFFAGFLLFGIFLSLFFATSRDMKRNWRYVFYAVAFSESIAVLFTAVRGSIAALFFGLLVFFSLTYFKKRSRKTLIPVASLILAVILFYAVVVPFRNTPYAPQWLKEASLVQRMSEVSLQTYTLQTRFWMWDAAVRGWSKDARTMTVGYGPENFYVPFFASFNPGFYLGPGTETLFDRAHNMFMEVLATMGIVGLLSYLFIFTAFIIGIWRIKKSGDDGYPIFVTFLAFVVAYSIHNSFIFDTPASYIGFFSVLGFISWRGWERSDSNGKSGPIRLVRPDTLYLIIVPLFGITGALIYYTNILPARANAIATRADSFKQIVYSQDAAIKNGVEIPPEHRLTFSNVAGMYKDAIAYDTSLGIYEYRKSFAQYLWEYTARLGLTEEVKPELIIGLEESGKNAKTFEPDMLSELYLARLNMILGEDNPQDEHTKASVEHVLKALEYGPKFVRANIEAAHAYRANQDYATALEYMQHAYDLNSDATGQKELLGEFKAEAELFAKWQTQRVLEEREVGTKDVTDDNIARMNQLLEQEKYTELLWKAKSLTEQYPKNGIYFTWLSIAYAYNEQYTEAVAAASQAAQIDPSLTKEAEEFIKEIVQSGKYTPLGE